MISKLKEILTRFWREETGAGYAVSVIMAIPFYVLFLCFIAELFMLMIAHLHVETAAFAAARSACVWDGQTGADDNETALHAAAISLVPVASGQDRHRSITSLTSMSPATRIALQSLYSQRLKGGGFKVDYMGKKIDYAYSATSVSLTHEGEENRTVTATVEYEAPLHFPGIAQVIGRKRLTGGGYYYPLRSVASLPSERAKTKDGKIGVRYEPR